MSHAEIYPPDAGKRQVDRAQFATWPDSLSFAPMPAGFIMSAPLELLSLNHLSFEVKRLEASVAFYRDILGFAEMSRPDLGFAGAWIRNGAACIHLIEKPSLPEPGPTIDPRGNHTAFEVKSAAEVKARLDAAGIPYRANELRGTPITQVFFRDPDGYQIEVADYSVGR